MNTEENKNKIESFIRYEKALNGFFRALGLKPAQCQFIRALIIICGGNKKFEASANDFTGVLYAKNPERKRQDADKVRYALKALKKWQEDNQITLIKIDEPGGRVKNENNLYDYKKTKYAFVGLDELVNVIYSDMEDSAETLQNALDRLKEQYQPAEKRKKYHPNHTKRIDKNNIKTKLRKVFDLSIEAGMNPVEECQRLIDDCQTLLNGWEFEWLEEQHKQNLIDEFESMFETGEVLNADSIHTENYHLITTGIHSAPANNDL
jgi:hypothetical protein